MKNRVFKRLAATVVTAAMLSGAALAAPADELAKAADNSNLLRQGTAQTVTAASAGAAVTEKLDLPAGIDADKTVTVLVESDGAIRYILGAAHGNSVTATYQENGEDSFTMLVAQGAIDQGYLTITSEAVKSGSSYEVTYEASLSMSDDLAILAAENKADSEKLKALRFTCVLEDDLVAQLTSVSEADVMLRGNDAFEFVSAETTTAGISVVYKLVPEVVDSWASETVSVTDVSDQLQRTMSISCTRTVTADQISKAQNSAHEIYTYGDLKITNVDGSKISIVNADQIVVPAELAEMAFRATDTTPTRPSTPVTPTTPTTPDDIDDTNDNDTTGIADPVDTGVATLLNTDDHFAFMQGDDTGNFRPDEYIRRCEVAQMFYNLLRNQNVTTTVSFSDVAESAWYADAVNALASLGIVNGEGNNIFNAERNITRAEFAAICARFAKAAATGEDFADVAKDHWAYNEIMTASSYGWVNGVGGNRFEPDRSITRAEAAAIVNRMLGRLADQNAIDSGAGVRFPDVASTHWAWYNIVEATSDHEYTMNSDRTQETWGD